MMRKKVILVVIFICFVIGCGTLFFFNKDSIKSNANSITYESSKYDDSFDNYEEENVDLNNVDKTYSITKAGVYHFTGTLNGYITVNTSDNVKIILDHVTITNESGPCIYIMQAKNAYVELIGENKLTDGSNYSNFDSDVDGVIYSKDDLIIEGDGTLTIHANYQDGIVSKDDLVIKSGTYIIDSNDDAIRGKDSVTIIEGTFTITSKGDGIKTSNETDTDKGNILIQNGTFQITSTNDAIDATNSIEIDDGKFNLTTGGGAQIKSTSDKWGFWGNSSKSSTTTTSAKGIKAAGSIFIKKITLDASTSDDTIHSNTTVEINDGTLNISSGDDGIHADSTIVIKNGKINIKQSYEGIEANTITIHDGEINVVASDDGINVSGGNDSSAEGRPGSNNYASTSNSNQKLTINGGTIYVNASGDGLDANGSIYINGGTVTVDGPTDNGNGALDYDGALEISGGTLIAAGSAGMMQNATSSKQGTILIYFSTTQNAGTTVKIGNDISYTPSKQFNCILVSSSSLKEGESYTVTLNGEDYQTFTLTSNISTLGNNTSRGNMNDGGGMNGPQRGRR